MLRNVSLRNGLPAAAIAVSAALAFIQPGCAAKGEATSAFDDLDAAAGTGDDATTGGAFPDGYAPPLGTSDAVTAGTLRIDPADAVVTVTFVDGVLTSGPVVLKALANGSTVVAASWTLDRSDLGAFDASGALTPSGRGAGVGTITAKYGDTLASTTVTLSIQSTRNGGGDGGDGGVGGTGPGGPVDPGTKGALQGPGVAPGSAADLGWLYPYDKTVWPRGLLAPLVQWQTKYPAAAVSIHLKQKYFEYQGFYSGTALVNQPVDESAWYAATHSNTGDALHVEIKTWDGSVVHGPIAEDWTIAPGVLTGTVYYDSYNTRLSSNGGASLAIRPGAPAPTLAIQGETRCYVCHTLSGDGSTLFVQHDNSYADGSSHDLQNAGQLIASYTGTSPDGITNDRKFLWSGVYPNGQFAMASSRYTRESFREDSQLFWRADGTKVPATGWEGVKSAVTPAFSLDGAMLAFNYWEGTQLGGADGGAPIVPGAGRSLVVMDFACGAQNGGITCGAPPYAFGNAREVYRDTTGSRYVGWPAFLPDGKSLLFHNALKWGHGEVDTQGDGAGRANDCTATPTTNTTLNCMLSTWHGAQAEIWMTDVPSSAAATAPVALDTLGGKGYLPTSAQHPNDAVLNYEPTVNPIASGGYYWVVFTSRRMYGNVASGDPYANGNGSYPVSKKLWVAAIDLNHPAGVDPSHPAFYLPGQELNAGNMRGHWVVDPCRVNGKSCETGDECCNGYCRAPDDGGAPVCQDKPAGCAQEFEKCASDGDCCGESSGFKCLNGHCARPPVK